MRGGFERRGDLWVPAPVRYRYIGRGSSPRFGGGGSRVFTPPIVGGNLCDPILPAPVDTTYSLPGGTVWTPADSAAFQSALNNAVLGDVIILNAGTVYPGPFLLPVKTGSGWIYVISSGLNFLPGPGSRVGPSNVGAMPTLRMPNAFTSIIDMAGAAPAHHFRFVGVHCDVDPSVTNTFGRGLIQIGDTSVTTPAAQAHHIIFDRCYMHGFDGTGAPSHGGTGLALRRALALCGQHLACVDSYISQIHDDGADSQAIWMQNGPGPYKIHNSHLEAGSENILVGGSDPAAVGMIPADITITRNYLFKPLTWPISGWAIKNNLELKLGLRVLIEGCVLENCWVDGQTGPGAVIWSVNQGGTAPWSETRDVWMRKCIIKNVCNGFQLTDHGGEVDLNNRGVPMTRVRIENVVIERMNNVRGAGSGVPDRGVQIQNVGCLQLIHNTIGVNSALFNTQELHILAAQQSFASRNNIYGGTQYGVILSGDGGGATCYAALSGPVSVHRDVFVLPPGSSSADSSNPHQPDCFFPPDTATIQFVNEAGGDYHLSPGSPFKGQGDDGLDPGADIDAVNAATAGVAD